MILERGTKGRMGSTVLRLSHVIVLSAASSCSPMQSKGDPLSVGFREWLQPCPYDTSFSDFDQMREVVEVSRGYYKTPLSINCLNAEQPEKNTDVAYRLKSAWIDAKSSSCDDLNDIIDELSEVERQALAKAGGQPPAPGAAEAAFLRAQILEQCVGPGSGNLDYERSGQLGLDYRPGPFPE